MSRRLELVAELLARADAQEQEDRRQHQSRYEQEQRDIDECARNTPESQDCGDERDDETDDCEFDHGQATPQPPLGFHKSK